MIQERDILRCDDNGNVTFQYRDAKTGKMAVRTLPGADFLWLVLQHVLPKGLRRARNFGFLHPNSAAAIRLLQLLHLRAAPAHARAAASRPAWRCVCGQPMFVVCRRMPALQPEALGQPKPPRAIRPDNPNAGQARTMHDALSTHSPPSHQAGCTPARRTGSPENRSYPANNPGPPHWAAYGGALDAIAAIPGAVLAAGSTEHICRPSGTALALAPGLSNKRIRSRLRAIYP